MLNRVVGVVHSLLEAVLFGHRHHLVPRVTHNHHTLVCVSLRDGGRPRRVRENHALLVGERDIASRTLRSVRHYLLLQVLPVGCLIQPAAAVCDKNILHPGIVCALQGSKAVCGPLSAILEHTVNVEGDCHARGLAV